MPNKSAQSVLTRLIKSRNVERTCAQEMMVEANDLMVLDASILTTDHVDQLDSLANGLTEVKSAITTMNNEIADRIPDSELENEVAQARNGLVVIQKRIDCINRFVRRMRAPRGASVNTTAATPAANMKLPKLDLPTFSGLYKDWTSFYDLFNASVHKNSSLSDSQKLHYLKTSLKADAQKVLTSVQITDANYVVARDLLERRYENKRAIVRAHIHAMYSTSPAKTESASLLRKLQETMEENVLALRAHGVPVDHWDAILVYLANEKMDAESRKQWELLSPGNDLQKYSDLIEFLEQRCRALEVNPKANQSSVNKPKNANKNNSKVAGTKFSYHQASECPCCDGAHRF